MGYIVNNKEQVENPRHGVVFEFSNPCHNFGHEYAERICTKCGRDFCYSCSGDQNLDQGGKYIPDFMKCPTCGHDYYS